jgi:serine/threonine protein kinase
MTLARCDHASCEQTDALLAARLCGGLDAARASALDRHLADCVRCCEIAEDLELPAERARLFPVVGEGVYELGDVLGYGGMGRIRRARDRRIGRTVALKELLFHTDVLAARFVREARVAASLQHPNIVPVYDVGSWADGTPFYTMRLVQGRSLYDALAGAPTLRDRMALLPAVVAASDAAAFAHASGIVHRDLTPANVLVGDFGETLVIDWGLAKDLRGDRERVAPEFQTGLTQQLLTANGDVLGSPAYMPPEQANGEPTDARADVYALGAILYHVLAGRAPYEGRTPDAVVAKVRTQAPASIDSVAQRAPRALVAIVATAMAREAGERYASARELAAALRAFTADALEGTQRGRFARLFERCG